MRTANSIERRRSTREPPSQLGLGQYVCAKGMNNGKPATFTGIITAVHPRAFYDVRFLDGEVHSMPASRLTLTTPPVLGKRERQTAGDHCSDPRQPERRTARGSAGVAPPRLGHSDNWGTAPPSLWRGDGSVVKRRPIAVRVSSHRPELTRPSTPVDPRILEAFGIDLPDSTVGTSDSESTAEAEWAAIRIGAEYQATLPRPDERSVERGDVCTYCPESDAEDDQDAIDEVVVVDDMLASSCTTTRCMSPLPIAPPDRPSALGHDTLDNSVVPSACGYAKPCADEPLPRKCSARSSAGRGPSRLGHADQWGTVPASLWSGVTDVSIPPSAKHRTPLANLVDLQAPPCAPSPAVELEGL